MAEPQWIERRDMRGTYDLDLGNKVVEVMTGQEKKTRTHAIEVKQVSPGGEKQTIFDAEYTVFRWGKPGGALWADFSGATEQDIEQAEIAIADYPGLPPEIMDGLELALDYARRCVNGEVDSEYERV